MHKNWWSDHVQHSFLERAKCVSDLYRFSCIGQVALNSVISPAAPTPPSTATSKAHSPCLKIWLTWGCCPCVGPGWRYRIA
jgi:hypothetical protein